ncbi:peptidase S8/S53 domain-containing protein [Choanephora cucurbitarum]|nr:peptidase S8/S53 domain-containing protein [Choanephora cucurbitarum]
MKIRLLSTISLWFLSNPSYVYGSEKQDSRLDSLFSNPKFRPNTLGNIIPGRFIIEFEDNYKGSSLDFVHEVQTMAEPNIGGRIKINIAHDFATQSSVFRGVSISLDEAEMMPLAKRDQNSIDLPGLHGKVLNKILNQNRVKHVYPVTEIARPNLSYANAFNIYSVENDTAVVKTTKVKIPSGLPELPFSHISSQVNEVHEKLNIKGAGILVGIIDSGIDYRHPAFGNGFGKDYPVKVGYDLVGNDYDSRDLSSRKQNITPLDDCENGNGHGTHVAGIIAANDKLLNFTGVAPEVDLGVWRVFGCDGSTSNDIVIKALLEAHEAGCDIINLSLGSPSNWAEDPGSIVANRIAQKGTFVIAAAGNEGKAGSFYIASPGGLPQVVASASVDNLYNMKKVLTTEAGEQYTYVLSSHTKDFPSGQVVSYTNDDSEEDACANIKPDKDINGKIVLVKRGGCFFDEKALNVEKYGGVATIIYDNKEEEDSFAPQVTQANISVSAITKKAGEELKSLMNGNKTSSINGIYIEAEDSLFPQAVETANQISKFSSLGPLYDMSLKPDFASPGGYIFSTLPLANGGYGVLSGTSMAAPYIAGAYALFLEAHGKNKTATFVKEHFQNYARPVETKNGPDSPARQGAGILQLFDTIQQPVHVSPGAISLNDTVNTAPVTLTISNPSNKTVSYKIDYRDSLAIAPYDLELQGFAPVGPAPYTSTKVTATLNFSVQNITLKPVPFIGIKGALSELPIFDDGYPHLLKRNRSNTFEHKLDNGTRLEGYVLDRSQNITSYVISVFRLLTGSPQVVTEVLDVNQTMIGTFSEENYVARNTMEDRSYLFTKRWNGTMIPIGGDDVTKLTALDSGHYYLRWKALKLFSDPAKEESWETKTSVPIYIKHNYY